LPAVAIRDGRIADVAIPRAEVAGGALKKEARRVRFALDHLAHRTHVIGADERVLPGERRGMARVIHDGAEDRAGIRNHLAEHHGVIGRTGGVEPAHDLLRGFIQKSRCAASEQRDFPYTIVAV